MYSEIDTYRIHTGTEEITLFQITNIKGYIKNNKFIYIGVLLLYFLGFAIGGLYSNFINDAVFFQSLDATKELFKSLLISKDAIDIKNLMITDLTPVIIIALCGITLIGLPFILFFIFKSGFSLGFYISFLIKAFSIKGFYLGMFYLFLNLLLILPAITAISVNSLELNIYILTNANKKYAAQRSFSSLIAICVFILVLSILLTVFSTNLKAMLLPDIVKFLFSSIL